MSGMQREGGSQTVNVRMHASMYNCNFDYAVCVAMFLNSLG